jgi:hypothetical protein
MTTPSQSASPYSYWCWVRDNDPVDFENSCRQFVAERLPCRVCGAREYLTPTGIAIDHDRNLHGADRDTSKKQPYHRSEPTQGHYDSLDP